MLVISLLVWFERKMYSLLAKKIKLFKRWFIIDLKACTFSSSGIIRILLLVIIVYCHLHRLHSL